MNQEEYEGLTKGQTVVRVEGRKDFGIDEGELYIVVSTTKNSSYLMKRALTHGITRYSPYSLMQNFDVLPPEWQDESLDELIKGILRRHRERNAEKKEGITKPPPLTMDDIRRNMPFDLYGRKEHNKNIRKRQYMELYAEVDKGLNLLSMLRGIMSSLKGPGIEHDPVQSHDLLPSMPKEDLYD